MDIEACEFIALGDHQPSGRRWYIKPHSHPQVHELIVVHEGSQHVRIGGHVIRAEEGDALLYRRNVVHEEWSEGRLHTSFIAFRWPELPNQLPTRWHDAGGRIRMVCDWILSLRKRPGPWPEAQARLLFRAAMAHSVELCLHPPSGMVERTRDYIADHIAQPIRLEDLAANVGLSKYHFVRRYRALTGQTPMQALRLQRVHLARDLILTTSLPIKAVADKTGLADAYHLCRVFRKCLNLTPGQIRKQAASRNIDHA